jgi:SAM-dependent methyltransferase
MQRAEVEALLKEALRRLQQTAGENLPAGYLDWLEAHFQRLDRMRTELPLWPCNLNLVPAPPIRASVGPVSYRMFFYGLAEHLWLLRHVCSFRGNQHLLDVGCGYGKTALALLRTIRPPGSYTGFDIDRKNVQFMNTLFQQLGVHGHFRADYFPIRNRYYPHPDADQTADEFIFPYQADSFDCAVLHSVFTHMLSEGVANYAFNLARVVRTGGNILVSVFLLQNSPKEEPEAGPWAESSRRQGLQQPPDPTDWGRLKVLNPKLPEFLVAYNLDYLTATFRRAGCRLVGEPLWGSWSGRADFLSYQDDLLFRKEPRPHQTPSP